MYKPSSLQIIPVRRDTYILQFEYINDEVMKYFKQKIDEKVGSMSHKTNVKGEMTDYHAFLKDPTFISFFEKFFMLELRRYQNMFPLKENTLGEQIKVDEAWGNKLEKGNKVIPHTHPSQWSSILYFCDSAPLKTELGSFPTSKGKIITLHGWIGHWVEPVNKERYSLVWNWNYFLPKGFKK